MAKILTDQEMLAIIGRSIVGKEIDDQTQYLAFLDDLAVVIADHHGGRVGTTDYSEGEYMTAFHITDEVPGDGGVFAKYDTDVIWVDGVEHEEKRKNKRIDDSSDIYEFKKQGTR